MGDTSRASPEIEPTAAPNQGPMDPQPAAPLSSASNVKLERLRAACSVIKSVNALKAPPPKAPPAVAAPSQRLTPRGAAATAQAAILAELNENWLGLAPARVRDAEREI